jgi:lipoprotein-anchoring transpeptidase ErfK/SrfK
MSLPSGRSRPVSFVAGTRPITGERTVLPVIGFSTGADDRRWLEVMVPGRPDGRTGWVRQQGTTSSTTPWRIVVETARRRVIVYHDGVPVRVFVAIVGKPSTPTPLGRFFVEEVVALPPEDVGAPYALALSARSNVLQEFDGGPGQIALHGLGDVGGVLGTAVSHGCVRLASTAMSWLVARISPGVTVTVTT